MSQSPPHDLIAGNHWLLTAPPQAGPDLRHDHFSAMICPRGIEIPVVEMIRGWLASADLWGRYTGVSIGSEPADEGMYQEWRKMGYALRDLLARCRDLAELATTMGDHPCRLNFATLDRMIVAAIEWQDLEAEAEQPSSSHDD